MRGQHVRMIRSTAMKQGPHEPYFWVGWTPFLSVGESPSRVGMRVTTPRYHWSERDRTPSTAHVYDAPLHMSTDPSAAPKRILGTTARRVVYAIFVTALIPLVAGLFTARTIIARVSATAFQPE